MKKNSMTGRIVKNVNRVLEVIPRSLNKDAEVIKLDFKKPRKARKASRRAKRSKSLSSRVMSMKAGSSPANRSRKNLPATTRAKRAVKGAARGIKRKIGGQKSAFKGRRSAKRKTAHRSVARAA